MSTNKVIFILSHYNDSMKDVATQLELSEVPTTVEVISPNEIEKLPSLRYEVVVIDVDQANKRGPILIQNLRRKNSYTPIVVLSEQGSPETAVYYFNMGADDFVRMPVDVMELASRIRAKLRLMNFLESLTSSPNTSNTPSKITIGEAEIDLNRMIVQRGKETIVLTPKEVGILRLLYRKRGNVVTRTEFLQEVWLLDDPTSITDRVVDTNILNLRTKIGDGGRHARYIKTIFGVGYLLVAE